MTTLKFKHDHRQPVRMNRCSDFYVEQYLDYDRGTKRWAVLHWRTRVWYFPAKRGRAAAEQLARKLNNAIEGD